MGKGKKWNKDPLIRGHEKFRERKASRRRWGVRGLLFGYMRESKTKHEAYFSKERSVMLILLFYFLLLERLM